MGLREEEEKKPMGDDAETWKFVLAIDDDDESDGVWLVLRLKLWLCR